MQLVSMIPALPVELRLAMAAVAFVLLFWLWMRLMRRHYLVIGRSETTEQLEIQLERIARAVERLASRTETQFPSPEPPKEKPTFSVLGS